MKAIVYRKYGLPKDVLRLEEVAKPVPKEDEVLVKMYASSLNQYDWHLMTADIFLVRLSMGLFRPKHSIPGADIAGQVEAVGRNVQQFQPGNDVFGDISACGAGGFAEYVAVPENFLVRKPTNVTFEEAAAIPMAALTALQGLRDEGKLQPGHKVLIQGASGGVGTFALQIAKAFGAEVTAVCSTRNMDQSRALGADHVIDYTREDFTESGRQYDLIFAANGYHPLTHYQRVLTSQGVYVMAGGQQAQIFQALLFGTWMSRKGGKKMSVLSAKPNQQDLTLIKDLFEAGKVRSVIDRCYPLKEAVEAMQYLGTGHARGKIIVTI